MRQVARLAAIATVLAIVTAVPGEAQAQDNGNGAGNPVILETVRDLQRQLEILQSALTKSGADLSRIPPAWSQKLDAADRFELVLDDAGVLDRETGLVWERAPGTIFPFQGPQTWNNAIATCRQIAPGSRYGWRLPTVEELQTLIDADTANHTLPPGHPFQNIQTANFQVYWSSTIVHGNLPFAYVVGFNFTSGSNALNLPNHVWCVRGGSGVTPL
jgi:hypothetical protein